MGETILIGVLVLVIIIAICGLIFFLVTNPSLSRNWSPDQAVMPSIHFLDNNKVRINNIRDINYRTTRDFDLEFYDRTINLDDLESAWLVISPFGAFGVAHTFVSFGLKDGTLSVNFNRGSS